MLELCVGDKTPLRRLLMMFTFACQLCSGDTTLNYFSHFALRFLPLPFLFSTMRLFLSHIIKFCYKSNKFKRVKSEQRKRLCLESINFLIDIFFRFMFALGWFFKRIKIKIKLYLRFKLTSGHSRGGLIHIH